LWAKRLDATQIHSQMHPVYGNKCFTKPTEHVWRKKILAGQIFASVTEVKSIIHQWLGQQPASFFALGIQKSTSDIRTPPSDGLNICGWSVIMHCTILNIRKSEINYHQ